MVQKARLLTKIKLAKDASQFDWELVSGELNFQAGQHLSIKLPEVRAAGEGSNVRYFSLVSSPSQTKTFSIATRSSNSAFKQALFGLPLESEAEVGGVSGQMVLPVASDEPLVFIAGGIGITPFMSMLTRAQEEARLEPLTLLYSNRTRSSAVYLDELEKLAQELANFKLVTTMTEDDYWPGEKRRIDADFIKDYVGDFKAAKFFVAGPPALVLAMTNNFDKLGLVKEHYLVEEFFGY